MKIETDKRQNANGLVVVVSVVATILALLGAAVSYTWAHFATGATQSPSGAGR